MCVRHCTCVRWACWLSSPRRGVWAVPGAEPPIAAGIIFGHNRARSGPDSQPRYPPICCVPFVSLHAMLITDLSLFVCGRVGASRHGGFPRGPPTPTSRYGLNRACRTARALLLTTCWLCHVPQAQISVGPAHPEFAALLKQVGGVLLCPWRELVAVTPCLCRKSNPSRSFGHCSGRFVRCVVGSLQSRSWSH